MFCLKCPLFEHKNDERSFSLIRQVFLTRIPLCPDVLIKSLKAKRPAAIMSLIQSARMNGHDAYLKHLLTRLPPHKASEISCLQPHYWR